MNVVKKFISVICSILLYLLISFLTLSFVTKNVIQHQIVGTIIKTEILSEVQDNNDLKIDIEKEFDNKDINKIIDIIIDEYVNSIGNENYTVSDETVDTIIDYFVSHEEEIETLTKEDVDINDIKSKESHDNFKKILNEEIKNSNDNIDDNVKKIIKLYNFLTSNNFRIMLIVSIIAITILNSVINNSILSILSSIGVPTTINGTIITFGYFMTAYTFKKFNIISSFDLNKVLNEVNFNLVLYIGILEIIIGIILCVIKVIIEKNKKIIIDN